MEGYWIALLVGAAVVLTVVYQLFETHRNTVTFLAAALAVAAALGQMRAEANQAQQLAFQARDQATQVQEQVKHGRVEISFRYMATWRENSFRAILPYAAAGLESVRGKAPEEMDKSLHANSQRLEALVTIFNFFEDVGLAVRTGYADNGALCQYFSEPALRYFSVMRPWLAYYRESTGRRGAYEHYQWLYESWEKGCPVGSLEK